MTNVVQFPKAKRDGTPPQSMEELLESVEATRKEHIEMVMDEALSYFLGAVYEEGYDLTTEKCLKPVSMLVESLRAAMYKSVDFHHPLHDISETMFVMDGDEAAEEESNAAPE